MTDGGVDRDAAVWVIWSDSAARTVADDLLRGAAARLLGCRSEGIRVARLCPACGSSGHGQPVVRAGAGEVLVSIGRSDAVTVVAVTLAGAVGVDVEREDAAAFEGFADVALHPRERAGARRERTMTWVRKEAVLKVTGLGLGVDPSTLRLSDPTDAPSLVQWPGHERLASHIRLYDVQTAPGHVTALAVLADATPRVVVSRAGPAVASPAAR